MTVAVAALPWRLRCEVWGIMARTKAAIGSLYKQPRICSCSGQSAQQLAAAVQEEASNCRTGIRNNLRVHFSQGTDLIRTWAVVEEGLGAEAAALRSHTCSLEMGWLAKRGAKCQPLHLHPMMHCMNDSLHSAHSGALTCT